MAPAGLYGGAGGRSAHERGTRLPARACQGAEVAVGPGCSQPPPRRWGFAEQLEEPHEFTPYHVVCPRAGCSAAVLLRVHPHPPQHASSVACPHRGTWRPSALLLGMVGGRKHYLFSCAPYRLGPKLMMKPAHECQGR